MKTYSCMNEDNQQNRRTLYDTAIITANWYIVFICASCTHVAGDFHDFEVIVLCVCVYSLN